MKVKVIVIGVLGNHRSIDKGTSGLRNKRTSGDPLNDNIIKVGQNTKKSPGDLWRLAIVKTPVRNHRVTGMKNS